MEELIKQMKVNQLVELINECADEHATAFPYIMDNYEDETWNEIGKYLDAREVAVAVSNGRYNETDRWVVVITDSSEIISFCDTETLFQHLLSPQQIADLFTENGIELSVKATKKR